MHSKSIFSFPRIALVAALLTGTAAMAQVQAAGQAGPGVNRSTGLASKAGGGGGGVVPYTCQVSSITGKNNCTCTSSYDCYYLKEEQSCSGAVVESDGKRTYNDCTPK